VVFEIDRFEREDAVVLDGSMMVHGGYVMVHGGCVMVHGGMQGKRTSLQAPHLIPGKAPYLVWLCRGLGCVGSHGAWEHLLCIRWLETSRVPILGML
jgi:hypothetical protein